MKKNKKQLVINSNWTAVKSVKNWKHYRISGRFYEGKVLMLEPWLCDRQIKVEVASVFALDDNYVSG